MHKHHGRHNDPSHHAHILMYGSSAHHAGGGPAAGNMAINTSSYKKGGPLHRRRHAEGDMAGKNPITGTTSPDIIAKSRGGRACHAEGDTVAVPYGRGGKTHRHRRHRHAEGDGVSPVTGEKSPDITAKKRGGRACHGFGDFVRNVDNGISNLGHNADKAIAYPFQRHADGGSAALLRHGGGAHHHKRHRHAKGEMAELMARGGHKKKKVEREHHSFGSTAGNVFSKIAPLLPLFLAEGGSAEKARHLAVGGVGKLRKGMLSKSGKILNAPIHSPMHMPFRSRRAEYRPG